MALSLVAVGAKITAAITNGIINAVNAGGMSLVAPSTVAGTGVSTSTLGKVSFTGASSVSVNGVFTTTYDNYLVVLEITNASATTQINIRARTGGTDDSGTNYNYELGYDTGTSHTATSNTGQTSMQLTGGAAVAHSIRLEVRAPALASAAHFLGDAGSATPGAVYVLAQSAGGHQVASAIDGFTILPSTSGANLTGTLRVYGYNNG